MWKRPQPQPPCWGRSFGEDARQLGTGLFHDFGRTPFGLIITSSAPLSFVMVGIPVVFHQGTTHLAVLSFIAGAVWANGRRCSAITQMPVRNDSPLSRLPYSR